MPRFNVAYFHSQGIVIYLFKQPSRNFLSYFNWTNDTHSLFNTSFTRSCQIQTVYILPIDFWSCFFCPAVQLAQITAPDVIDALATDVGVT